MYGKFKNLGLAQFCSNNTIKMSVIMHGDDNHFWVVNLATMERLVKVGYELAE